MATVEDNAAFSEALVELSSVAGCVLMRSLSIEMKPFCFFPFVELLAFSVFCFCFCFINDTESKIAIRS